MGTGRSGIHLPPQWVHVPGVLPNHIVDAADGWAPDGRVVPVMVAHVLIHAQDEPVGAGDPLGPLGDRERGSTRSLPIALLDVPRPLCVIVKMFQDISQRPDVWHGRIECPDCSV